MKIKNKFCSLNTKGHGIYTLLLVLALIPALVSLMATSETSKTKVSERAWTAFIVQENARSAFVLMEAALRRRMWEPPPDSQCLRSQNFTVSGISLNGISYTVTGRYDPWSRIIELISESQKNNIKYTYRKFHKLYDMSDYLYLSPSTDPKDEVVLSRGFKDHQIVSGLIAGSRRIQIAGRLRIDNNIRPLTLDSTRTSRHFSDFKDVMNPSGFGTLIQGERIEIGQGIYYGTYNSPSLPHSSNPTSLVTALTPYVHTTLGGTATTAYYTQSVGSVAVITKDYQKALAIDTAVRNSNPITSLTDLQKNIYPWALFSSAGGFPMIPNPTSDTGAFFNDISQFLHFDYPASGGSWFPANLNCLSLGVDPDSSCSASWRFPLGFKAWRTQAGLDHVLLTEGEATVIQAKKLNWDNFEALKSDSKLCGVYIDPGEPGHTASAIAANYEDCDLSNQNIIKNYSIDGNNHCERIQKLDTESLGSFINNYSASVYNDASIPISQYSRRVIYSTVPLEVPQMNAQGLWSGLPDSIRQKISLLIVNEDKTILRPFQNDTSSPLTIRPDEVRNVFFNGDSTDLAVATRKKSLKVAFLSPEEIQVISPQHQAITFNHMQQMLPRVGTAIHPRRHVITDWIHQESDGFRYGIRNIRLENMAVVTQQKTLSDEEYQNPHRRPFGIHLRGLWSATSNTHYFRYVNSCMFANPSSSHPWVVKDYSRNLPLTTTPYSISPAPQTIIANAGYISPSLPGLATDKAPPITSVFYKNGNQMYDPYPYVFFLQDREYGLGSSSSVQLSGSIIRVGFESETPAGRKNLSLSSKNYSEFIFDNGGIVYGLPTGPVLLSNIPIDISNRRLQFDSSYGFIKNNTGSTFTFSPLTIAAPGGASCHNDIENYASHGNPSLSVIHANPNLGFYKAVIPSFRNNGGFFTLVNTPVQNNFSDIAILHSMELSTLLTGY